VRVVSAVDTRCDKARAVTTLGDCDALDESAGNCALSGGVIEWVSS